MLETTRKFLIRAQLLSRQRFYRAWFCRIEGVSGRRSCKFSLHYRPQAASDRGNGDEAKGRETKQNNLFKARLDRIIYMRHPRVLLAQQIDWRFFEQGFGAAYSDGPGSPPLPTRLMVTLHILARTSRTSGPRTLAFSILLRGVLPAQARLRSLVANAQAPAQLRTNLGRVMRTSAVRLQAKRVCRSS
jgi:hypothetical protein